VQGEHERRWEKGNQYKPRDKDRDKDKGRDRDWDRDGEDWKSERAMFLVSRRIPLYLWWWLPLWSLMEKWCINFVENSLVLKRIKKIQLLSKTMIMVLLCHTCKKQSFSELQCASSQIFVSYVSTIYFIFVSPQIFVNTRTLAPKIIGRGRGRRKGVRWPIKRTHTWYCQIA